MPLYYRRTVLLAVVLTAAATTFATGHEGGWQHIAQTRAQPPPASSPAPSKPSAQPSAGSNGTPASETSPGTPAVVIDDKKISTILGKGIRGKDGENMGRIVDVLVSQTGQLRAVVIDFGGFLGVGSRKIAVDWNALRFASAGKPDQISLDLTKEQVRVAPEYKDGAPVVILGAPAPPPADTNKRQLPPKKK